MNTPNNRQTTATNSTLKHLFPAETRLLKKKNNPHTTTKPLQNQTTKNPNL